MSPPCHRRRALILWGPTVLVGLLFIYHGATTGDTRPQDVGAMLTALGLFALICDRPHPTHA